jgi:GrpB protein
MGWNLLVQLHFWLLLSKSNCLDVLFTSMKMVHFFVPAEGYLQKVAILIEEHRSKILRLVPTSEVEHIGATSVLGLLTKGDLDLQVSVSQQEFDYLR